MLVATPNCLLRSGYENVWIELNEAAIAEAPFVRYIPGAEGAGLTALATVHRRDVAQVGRLRRDNRDPSGRRRRLLAARMTPLPALVAVVQ